MKHSGGFALCGLLCLSAAQADQASVSGQPGTFMAAAAKLDFEINIGKFLFFRVGSNGAFPTTSTTIDEVVLNTNLDIPGLSLVDGDNLAANWNGALPAITSTTAVLPVEVHSNAGQVSIRASINSPLSNGSNTIPFSGVLITSSDTGLPAPPVPDSGTGNPVNVSGTSFANLITVRNANWTFSYTGGALPAAGSYTGEILFTASAP